MREKSARGYILYAFTGRTFYIRDDIFFFLRAGKVGLMSVRDTHSNDRKKARALTLGKSASIMAVIAFNGPK